ncbi:MAG: NAD(P)H-hydrate dehydratase [Campylobacterota bacterium]|nr:NAD(P)H-hydrate dehydratase [Campylobacterota bacterium]
MQNLFEEAGSLDQRCYEEFGLTEDLLMEHAADGMADYIRQNFPLDSSITIVCGPGNNGADGIAVGRLLHHDYRIRLLLPHGAASPMCQLQLKRAELIGLKPTTALEECTIIVDALFGTGFSRTFDTDTQLLLEQTNRSKAFRIACDVPSGVHPDGTLEPTTFKADVTLTMGALKRSLYSDAAKTVVGKVDVLDLGVSRSLYERPSSWQLLDQEDLKLPLRKKSNSHKGSYGHLSLICGEKEGAAVIAGSAALRFGAGLVTLISNEQVHLPCELMQSHLLPETTTAIAAGMGLGQEFSENELRSLLDNDLPMVIDADLFSHTMLTELLTRKQTVLTPHPKEFTRLLSSCALASIGVDELQKNRFHYVELFSQAYPDTLLLLKGANVIIAGEGKFFINPHGSNLLAKGGSGDVLDGLIGALLAQGYSPLEAAISGSLAHTSAAALFEHNNYAMTPLDLIDGLKSL